MSVVCFCHGLESGPSGYKSRSLVRAGYEVVAPDCRNQDLATRVDTISDALRDVAKRLPGTSLATLVVVGSSFGGIAGLIACMQLADAGLRVRGMVLCAPALHVQQPPADQLELVAPAPTIVVHGRADEVVPHGVSEAFAARSHPYPVEQWSVDDGHGLRNSHELMLRAVAELLANGGTAATS